MSPQTKHMLSQPHEISKKLIEDVPFYPQPDGDCGPTALAMSFNWAKVSATPDELRPKVLTPSKQGSLPSDMISATRSYGLLAVEINQLDQLISELSDGHPVIVFLNEGFSWAPSWHYAVAVGFDLDKQVLVLNSGETEHLEMPFTHFERHWSLTKFWSIVTLPPKELANSAGELKNMKAASGLEAANQLLAAETAYNTVLEKWPTSLSAHLGLSNIAYKKNDLKSAIQFLKKAETFHPSSPIVKNNLEILEQQATQN